MAVRERQVLVQTGSQVKMQQYQIDDTHRRIRNILKCCPATEWTLEESQAVLAVLAGILRARQSGGEVIDLGA